MEIACVPVYKGIIGVGSLGVNSRQPQGMPERSGRIILLGHWDLMLSPELGSGAS